ncbi:MAG: hypothetical protein RI637_11800, partial [Acidimicrobiia bacterium]|nr:hypothetical protein [Acidimicrobiia bacterium]
MISQAQFTDSLGTVMNEFDGLAQKTEQTGEEMSQFWIQAARNMENSMSGLFFDVMQGQFDD